LKFRSPNALSFVIGHLLFVICHVVVCYVIRDRDGKKYECVSLRSRRQHVAQGESASLGVPESPEQARAAGDRDRVFISVAGWRRLGRSLAT